jgi:hypothetical protein
MKRALVVAFGVTAAWYLSTGCGFGFDDDRGTPTPAATYWGWQCADGSLPDPDAGCLPATCDDGSVPSDADGGDACLCDDGTQLLSCTGDDGGCGGD